MLPDEAAPEPLTAGVAAAGLTRGRAAAEVFLCSGLPTQLLLTAGLSAVGITAMADAELSPRFVFAISILDTLVLLALVFAFLALSHERPAAVFLGTRSPVRESWLGLLHLPALFLLVAGVSLLVRAFAPGLRNVPDNPFGSLLDTPAMQAAFVALVVVAGGVREELQRAFLLHRFEQRLGGAHLGLVVTSAGFGLGHTVQGWDAALATAALGAFWAVVYLTRRSVVANVTSHAAFNVLQVLVGFSARGVQALRI